MVDLAIWFATDAIIWLVQKPARLVFGLLFVGLAGLACVALFAG